MDNKSVAINKSQATTCCGSGSNEFGAINKYKYGPNNNKSGVTCCCGCVSIETGTYVVAIVLCVIDILWAILCFFLHAWEIGIGSIIEVCICLLVGCGQQVRNPWLFVPYLILGVLDICGRVIYCVSFLGCMSTSFILYEEIVSLWIRLLGREGCAIMLGYYAVSIPLSVWFYSIILRGFSAVKEVESRRYRPHF